MPDVPEFHRFDRIEPMVHLEETARITRAN